MGFFRQLLWLYRAQKRFPDRISENIVFQWIESRSNRLNQDLKSPYFDGISPKITQEGCQLVIDTDSFPVEPSVDCDWLPTRVST